jgi:hypothetical protein
MTIAAAAGDAAAPATARVYLLASDVGGFAQLDVYKSHDGGQSFAPLGVNQTRTPLNPNADQTDLNVMHDQAWYNQAIAVDPANGDTVFVGGNLALVRSTDGGGTWKVIADWLPYDFTVAGVTYNSLGIPYVHADFHAMAIGTARARVFYAGTDGGIFRSSDAFAAAPGVPATGPGGVVSPTFDDSMNRGLPTHLLYTVCAGAEDVGSPAVILGGLQDNGSRLRNAGTPTNFDMVTGGDGIGCGVGKAFGTGAFGTLLITTFPGDIARSTNSGVDFKRAVTGLPATIDGQTNFHMRIANDPTDATAQTFLTPINSAASASGVTAQVFRTTDGAANWSDITGAVNGGGPFPKELLGVFASAAAPGNYLAFSAGRIFVTTNATVGATAITWSMNSTVFAQQPISSAAFDPNDTTGSIAWVTSHAPPNLGHHVFRATAANTSTPVWTDMSGTGGANPLPDVPATIVRLDPRDASSKTIYVGTDIGLYASTDGGANWTRFGSGMPAVKITDLAIARDGTSLRIATFGRGFWELYPNAGVPAAVAADGDHDGNQMIDGFDLIAEAAALGADVSSPTYDPKSHLTGTTNSITWADMLALLAKFGGRP